MATTTPEEPAKSKKRKKGGKLRFFTIMIVLCFAAAFNLPTVVLIMAGMCPTIIVFFVDKDDHYSSAIAIGAMNFAGITPFVIDLWIKGQSMGNIFQLLREPGTWLIILGAAAIGQMIVAIVPQAMATVTLAHSEARIKNLKQNLELLKSSWGPDVGSTKPLDQLTRH